jgi:hypothetical protein
MGDYMDYFRKLPLLMALASALITGFAGIIGKVPQRENIIRMFVVMAVFFAAGLLLRNTIVDIVEYLKEKNENQKNDIKEKENNNEGSRETGKIIDLSTKQNDMDFSFLSDDKFKELPVADYIKEQLKIK